MQAMLQGHDPGSIETLIAMEVKLASISTCWEMRAMHEDLEQFYRTQLASVLVAERLADLRTR